MLFLHRSYAVCFLASMKRACLLQEMLLQRKTGFFLSSDKHLFLRLLRQYSKENHDGNGSFSGCKISVISAQGCQLALDVLCCFVSFWLVRRILAQVKNIGTSQVCRCLIRRPYHRYKPHHFHRSHFLPFPYVHFVVFHRCFLHLFLPTHSDLFSWRIFSSLSCVFSSWVHHLFIQWYKKQK